MKHFNLLHSMAFVFIAILSLGFTSCTEEELEDRSQMPSDAIKFTVSEAKTETRTSLDSKKIRQHLKSFYVSAFLAKTYQGMIPDNDFYMKDVEIVNDGKGNFSYRKDEKTYPWPAYPLNFVAINNMDYNGRTPPQFIEGKLDIGCFRGGSIDYVCAYTTNQDKNKNGGTVDLQFHHLMSQIRFYVAERSLNLNCDIKKIGLKGVYDIADMHIDPAGNITVSEAQDNLGMGDYSIDVTDYVPDQEPVLLNYNKELFIPPLTQKGWNPSSNILPKDIDDAIDNYNPEKVYAYVWMECKIQKNGKYLVGSENSYGRTCFPFKVNLKPGKRYNYVITLTDDFIGYPDQNTTLQEPKLGWVISDAGNIYRHSEDAIEAGEDPVAMIAYINENGDGPAPYSKHGLAISLSWLRKYDGDRFFTYSDLENISTWFRGAPAWTQWYVPGFREFDLIFDACGGTQYDGRPHYRNQPWNYGDINESLESTEQTPGWSAGEEYPHLAFEYFYPEDSGYSYEIGQYWLNPSENSNSSMAWLYNSRVKQYWQWPKQSPAGLVNMVRPVFEF